MFATRFRLLLAMVLVVAGLVVTNSTNVPVAQAASVTINHYVNGEVVGTHTVPDSWFAIAIRLVGLDGEKVDELYHFCMKEENFNHPACASLHGL